jgi:hypothetical protein
VFEFGAATDRGTFPMFWGLTTQEYPHDPGAVTLKLPRPLPDYSAAAASFNSAAD